MSNPYSPGPSKPTPANSTFRVDHGRAFNFIFENPNWMTNVLFLTLSYLIPLVGPLVGNGYQLEVVEQLHRSRGTWYPDFDFNRFGDYLVRGLWPFLVSMVISIFLVPLVWVLMFGGMAAFAAVAGNMGDIAIVVVPFIFVGLLILMIGCSMIMLPMVLKAGLQQDFSAAFDMNFAMDFVKHNFFQFFISGIIMYFLSLVMFVLGALVFCVGAYISMAIVNLMASHLLWQFYEVHLSKGGQPIPLKNTVPPQNF